MYGKRDHEHSVAGTRALWAILIVVAASVLVAFALPQTTMRKFPDRTPIHFWHTWTAEWKVVVDRIVATYNASQNRYEVIALSVPAHTAPSKILSSVAGGMPPDVIASWDPVIPKWAEGGIIMPLDDVMTSEERERVERSAYPIALKIGSYQGKVYGIVTGLDVYACYLRSDFARVAGLNPDRPPETLDELTAWGAKLDRFDGNGRLVRMGFLNPLSSVSGLAMFAPAFGGGLYDWDQRQLTLNTPDNLRALSFLAGTRERLGFANVVRFESGHSRDVSNAAWPFITGAYGITIDGQWRVEQIAQYAPDLDYTTFPIP
ncbi:MAG: extracellular solute-binding protein, partial [Candidatus Hydrogenedentes bacterium]|nr:extracellular solute-binding protein [Candidatus Hydrogenedentota bacterium]